MKPSNWHAEAFGGDDDFGFDLHVQVSHAGGVQHSFYVQLKGTEHPDLSADGSVLRYPLKKSTLNYYANTTQEVMLVVCVIELHTDGALNVEGSRIHWQWIADILKVRRESEFALDLSNTKTTTVHIPTSNVLSRTLDVVDRLGDRLKKLKFAASLEDILASSNVLTGDDLSGVLAQWAEKMRKRPEDFTAFVLNEEGFDKKAIPAEASEVRVLIRAGKTEAAGKILEKIGSDGFGSSNASRALWLSLSGKVAMQRMRQKEARLLFEQAYAIDSSEEYLLALAEAEFLNAIDANDFEKIGLISKRLAVVQTDEGSMLMVRVSVSLKDYQTAEKYLQNLQSSKRLISELVILSGKRDWDKVIALGVEHSAEKDIAENDRVAILLISSRAAWFKAIEDSPIDTNSEELPLSGPVGTKYKFAKIAWDLATLCMDGLRSSGWPLNIELLAPVICAVAGVIGKQESAITFLSEAADSRPEYLELQHSLEMLAIGAADANTALKANLRQVQGGEVLIRQVGLQFQLRRYAHCVRGALDIVRANACSEHNAPMSLAMGYASARKLAMMHEAKSLRSALEICRDSHVFLAFADFAFCSLEQPKSEQCLESLRGGLRVSPDSWFLAANLFSNLDVSDEGNAAEVVELAKTLRRHALLNRSEATHEIYAFFTLKRWEDASIAIRHALSRFGEEQQLLAHFAVAEEMLGRTNVAFDALERAMAAGEDRLSILHNYMGIALRLGRSDCVRQAVSRLLGIVADRTERLELLRLRTLLHIQDGEYLHARQVVGDVGRLVEQTSEEEEGMFVNLFLASTLNGPPADDLDREEFERRIDAFSAKWPESKVFRKVTFSLEDSANLGGVGTILDPLVEDWNARLQESKNREQKLFRGELSIPYVMRAGYAIHYIGNIFDLWEIAKKSSPGDKHLHLQTVWPGRVPRRDLTRDIPLIEITTLLVLDSLDIFDILFSVFQSIAIPRNTLAYISQQTNTILRIGPGAHSAKSILSKINKWIDRIEQPFVSQSTGRIIEPVELVREYLELLKTRRWVMYCDDNAVMKIATEEASDVPHLNTVSLFDIVDANEIISPYSISQSLRQLALWNVGIFVADRYLIASLEGAILDRDFGDARQRLASIERHAEFTDLFRAVVNPEKSPSDLVQHIGYTLYQLLQRDGSNSDSVSAFLGFWFNRVRLFRSAGELGWRLLAYPAVFALYRLPEEKAGRTISIVRTSIEICISDVSTSATVDSELSSVLGNIAAELGQRDIRLGTVVLRKLLVAMPLGTADGDRCFAAYTKLIHHEK